MVAVRDDDSAHGNRVRWLSIRVAGAAAIVFALALLPYRAIDSESLAMLARMRSDVKTAKARLSELRSENAELRRDIDALRSDPRAIEEFARRDLGMTRPGEIVLRFESGSGQ